MAPTQTEDYYFLRGGGEMGELTRNLDWSKTSVGTPDTWPQSLRLTVSMILKSKFPMFLFWGEDHIQFYNDAYRPSLGNNGKHPAALGQKGIECWPEIWDDIYPLIDKALNTGEASYSEDQLLPIYRNGKMEDVYWTFSYSPLVGDNGNVDGVHVVCTETTEKVKTIKALKQNEENLRSMVLDAPIGICIMDASSLVSEIVNDSFVEIAGKPLEEIEGKFYWDTFAEARSYYEEALDTVVREGVPYHANEVELMLIRGGKEEKIFVTFVYVPLKNSEGKVKKVSVWVLENTQQVASRQKVEQSEMEIRTLIEAAPFAIGVYKGPEMRVAFANKSIMDIWGKGNDVVGKLFSEVLPELDNQAVFTQLDEVYRTGIAFHIKNQPLDLIVDGAPYKYYFNYNLTPLFDAEGKVYGVMNTGVDLTELNLAKRKVEESEKNLRNTILQAPVAMCIFKGPQFVVEIANERMFELWGRPGKDILNKSIFDGLPEAREQGFEALLEGVYTTGKTFVAEGVPTNLPRNGQIETIYLNFVYEAHREADGSISGILAVATDVTAQLLARQKIEESVAERTKELAAANEKLHKSNAELEQFAYIASHDLQEPVRKITTFTQMLENSLGPMNEKSRGYLEKVNASANRMTALIRDVLAYSQLSEVNEQFERVNLNNIIEDIKIDFELAIEQKNAVIRYSGLPIIEAIPLQMSQLFGNLISNSLKYSKTDVAPEIEIKAELLTKEEVTEYPALNQNKSYHKIKFSDNGIGIKPEQISRVFNIFQRLHGKTEYAGTGIGLSICKKIVNNHHGDITALSSEGNGTTFVIILPKHFRKTLG